MSKPPPKPSVARNEETLAVRVSFPKEVVAQIDELAKRLEIERSEFIRAAIRRALRNPP